MGLFVIIWQISYNGCMNSTRKINMAKKPSNQICANKKARHEYFIEETFEAGLSLEGWEVKSIRAGKMAITDAYVILKMAKHFCLGLTFNPCEVALRTSTLTISALVNYCCTANRLINSLAWSTKKVMPLFLCHATGKAVVSNVKLP